MVNELQARLHSLYNGRTFIREVGPQMVGLERYRVIATGEQLYTLLEAADRIAELEAKLADTGQMYRDSFKRIRELEAALRKVDEWLYPGDSDLPHEVALMNEVHGLITPDADSSNA